jgi:uncharacterized protein (TIGR02217 family)
MGRFVDQYAPAAMPGFPCFSSPRFSTRLVVSDSGAEQANRRWQHPLRTFKLPEAVRTHTVFEAVKDHWLIMGGPAHTWPFRDPLDFASQKLAAANVTPIVTRLDQALGTGDGAATTFQLKKLYQAGAQTYSRDILFPIAASLLVGINGAASAISFSVSRPGGVVTFVSPPANGAVLTAGFLFDCEVRFESDSAFDGVVRSYQVSGFADLTLVETRFVD